MIKQSAKLLLLLNGLFLFGISANAGSEPVELLSGSDLFKPTAIKQWLMKNSSKADRVTAQNYFKLGQDYMAKKNWSAAAKSFGESAVFFPSPKALKMYADAELSMLGLLREKDKEQKNRHADLTHAIHLYESALASDEVLREMSDSERAALEKDIHCLKSALTEYREGDLCRPMNLYRLVK